MVRHFAFAFAALLAAVVPSFAQHAVAAGETWPRIEGAVAIEVQNDGAFRSDDPGNERNDLFTTSEPEATLRLAPGLSLFAHGVLEPVRDAAPGEDRAFEDHGLFVEDLWLAYEWQRAAIKGGKFTPRFGVAWDLAPGVYGTDFAEDGYELSERIGVEGRATFGNEAWGKHALGLSAFFLDTSALAHSAITGRGTLGRADGGVSNTEDLSSFAVSLDGGDVAGIDGLGYHLGFVRQHEGRDGSEAERGIAAALFHDKIALAPELSLTPLAEVVHFWDADGVDGQSRRFVTAGGRLDWRKWNLAVSATHRRTEAADDSSVDDYLVQASVGYAFDFGLSADVGWRRTNEDNVETHIFGALLAYTLEF